MCLYKGGARVALTDLEVYVYEMLDLERDMGCERGSILRVYQYESANMASAMHPVTKAVGIGQFIPQTLRNLGWTKTPEEFAQLSERDQIPYARRYFAPYRNRMPTLRQVYAAVFLPKYINECADPDYVLASEGSQVFALNSSFDSNGDHKIQAEELAGAARRACRGSRWNMISRYAGVSGWTGLYYGTTLWVQTCLASRGLYTGDLDNIRGPLYVKAVKAYQKSKGLADDGIVGPATANALKKEFGWQV